MTDLHIALAAAGVQLPTQTQRIWVWLKDHQPQTAKAISAALHLAQSPTLLSSMEKRGMVTSKLEHSRLTGGTVKWYSTVGRAYELLPVPKKTANKPQPPALQTQALDAPAATRPTAAFDLDALTIAEARALYSRLARMFKGETA